MYLRTIILLCFFLIFKLQKSNKIQVENERTNKFLRYYKMSLYLTGNTYMYLYK